MNTTIPTDSFKNCYFVYSITCVKEVLNDVLQTILSDKKIERFEVIYDGATVRIAICKQSL